MRRREFIALLAGATAAWPFGVRAQKRERPRRLGVLMSNAESDPLGQARIAALRAGLRELGWSEGGNLKDRRALGRKRCEPSQGLRRRTCEACAGRRDCQWHSGHCRHGTGDALDPHRVCGGQRPGRSGSDRELGAPRRQRHWSFIRRLFPVRQIAGPAQTNSAQDDACRIDVQAGRSSLLRRLSEVFRGGQRDSPHGGCAGRGSLSG